jgi:hypothetical protein
MAAGVVAHCRARSCSPSTSGPSCRSPGNSRPVADPAQPAVRLVRRGAGHERRVLARPCAPCLLIMSSARMTSPPSPLSRRAGGTEGPSRTGHPAPPPGPWPYSASPPASSSPGRSSTRRSASATRRRSSASGSTAAHPPKASPPTSRSDHFRTSSTPSPPSPGPATGQSTAPRRFSAVPGRLCPGPAARSPGGASEPGFPRRLRLQTQP